MAVNVEGREGGTMYKHHNLPFKFNIQLFAGEGDGGDGGSGGDGGNGGEGGGNPPAVIEIDGKKYDSSSIAQLLKDNHNFKSQAGDFKKQLETLQNKGKSELEVLQGNYNNLETDLTATKRARLEDCREFEAHKLGLDPELALEIPLADDDTRDSIVKKVKDKKEKIDKMLQDEMNKQGYKSKALGKGSGEGKSIGEELAGQSKGAPKHNYF